MAPWRVLVASPTGRNALLFACALLMRLSHLLLLRASNPEILEQPILDANHYHVWAQDILAGTGVARRVFFMHPAYPHLLAAVYAVTGPSPLAPALVQSALGAAGVVLFHDLCRRWFDARTAMLAAVVLLLYRPFVTNAALLETVELGVFLMLLSLWLSATAEGRRGWLRLVGSGAAFVLAGLCRGNLMLAAPALVAAPLLAGERPWPTRLRGSFAVAAGIALVMAGVGIRNRVVGGEWVWLTSSPGQTFYLGNYRGASTGAHDPPAFLRADPAFEETDYHAEAERLAGRPLTAKETSRFWFRRALGDLAAAPAFAAVRFLRKLKLTFAAYEIADNYNLAYLARLTPLRWVPLPNFLAIVGLAMVGAGLAWRRRSSLVLLYGPATLYAASLGVFYLSSRLRIYLVPFLIALAAHAAIWIHDALRARRFRPVAAALVGAVFVTVLSAGATPADIAHADWAQALNSHARALRDAGRGDEAERLWQRALDHEPTNAYLLVNVGQIALRGGDGRRGAELCRRAAALRPGLAGAHRCLGIALASLGDWASAEASLRRAVALDKDDPDGPYNLAVLLARTGRGEEARRLFSEILAAHPDHAGARRGLQLSPP